MFLAKLKKIISPFFKVILLLVVIVTTFYFHLELVGALVLIFIIASLLWKWETRVSLITGVFFIFISLIYKFIDREDLIIPHLHIFGWILVAFWLLTVIDYWVLHWPEHITLEFYTKIRSGTAKIKPSFLGVIKLSGNIFIDSKNIILFLLKRLCQIFLLLFKKLCQILPLLFKKLYQYLKIFFQDVLKKCQIYKILLIKIAVLIIIFFLLYYFTGWKIIDIFVWLFFVFGILFPWGVQAAVGLALLLLLMCPFLLINKMIILANIFAVYAYYFLIIGVFLSIKDCILDGKFQNSKKWTKWFGKRLK